MGALTEELLTFCDDLSECLRVNIEMLREDTGQDQIEAYLWDWAIVLGVLSRDVFESVVTLLDADKVRGANMISRALIDYDIRLRYYVVQCKKKRCRKKPRKKFTLKNLKGQIRAIQDWENANYKLISVLDLYDPNLWPPEIRKEIDRILSSNEKARSNRFSSMLAFLIRKEVEVRGVLPFLADKLVYRYSNMLPMWRMDSAFLHGDQVVVSDVLEFDENGKKTGLVFERSQAPPITILFAAINNVVELVRSFGMIRSFTPGIEALHDRAVVLWQKFKPM